MRALSPQFPNAPGRFPSTPAGVSLPSRPSEYSPALEKLATRSYSSSFPHSPQPEVAGLKRLRTSWPNSLRREIVIRPEGPQRPGQWALPGEAGQGSFSGCSQAPPSRSLGGGDVARLAPVKKSVPGFKFSVCRSPTGVESDPVARPAGDSSRTHRIWPRHGPRDLSYLRRSSALSLPCPPPAIILRGRVNESWPQAIRNVEIALHSADVLTARSLR